MESLCQKIADLAAVELGVRTAFVGEISWKARERQFRDGMIDVIWICGLPYVLDWDESTDGVSLLAAPVMSGTRYAGLPIYNSDIVVRRDSSYRSFMDLRGRRFAFNEPRSHSGYNVVCHRLATIGERGRYFGSAVESGAHQTSIEWVLDGRVDASAIDSTVLELEISRQPDLADLLVSIDTLGPSPIPPWLARQSLDAELRADLQAFLLTLHEHELGCRILETCNLARFVTVEDSHYDPIRNMAAQAATIRLE